MRFSVIFCIFIVLISCSSATRKFSGIDPVRVTIEGSVFDVYVNGNEAQIIRMNFEVLPDFATMAARAISAMEKVTGCRVVCTSFSGDQAMATARIKC